jgi:hypothetical protein
MRTTVEIADQLLEAAKLEAQRSECTLRDLIELGLHRELERRKVAERERERERSVKAAPFQLRDMSVAGIPQPGMRYDRLDWYTNMGRPGFPDTIEGINKMMDEDDEKKRR